MALKYHRISGGHGAKSWIFDHGPRSMGSVWGGAYRPSNPNESSTFSTTAARGREFAGQRRGILDSQGFTLLVGGLLGRWMSGKVGRRWAGVRSSEFPYSNSEYRTNDGRPRSPHRFALFDVRSSFANRIPNTERFTSFRVKAPAPDRLRLVYNLVHCRR